MAHQEEEEEITVCLKQGLVYLLTVRVAQLIYLCIGCHQSILHVFFLLNVIVKFLSSVNKCIRLFTGKSRSLPVHFYQLVSVQVCLAVFSFTFLLLFLKHPQVKSAQLLKIFADFVLKSEACLLWSFLSSQRFLFIMPLLLLLFHA